MYSGKNSSKNRETSMTNRRQFLQMSAAAASALPLATRAVNLSETVDSDPVYPFYKVIYDDRFADCRAFAREAASFTVLSLTLIMKKIVSSVSPPISVPSPLL